MQDCRHHKSLRNSWNTCRDEDQLLESAWEGDHLADPHLHFLHECLLLFKDTTIVYLLERYKGRTLIFTNSVDASRRMYGILRFLKFKPLMIHAKMEQKVRLKNLEKFAGESVYAWILVIFTVLQVGWMRWWLPTGCSIQIFSSFDDR